MKISANSASGLCLEVGQLFLKSDSTHVRLNSSELEINFSKAGTTPFVLGGISGSVSTDTSETGNIHITREIFKSSTENVSAIRIKVKNNAGSGFCLKEISPLNVIGQGNFLINKAGIESWKVLRFPFHKSDIPTYFSPSVVDKDFEDAVFSCIHAIPGQGVIYNTLNKEQKTVTSGPILIFKNCKQPSSELYMFSIIRTEQHFIDMRLTVSDDRKSLNSFEVVYNFDNIMVDRGNEVSTHWLLILSDKHESDLLRRYADIVANDHNFPIRVKKSPTIYCSWYFYTFEFTQKNLDEELKSIRQRNIPLDVFQIDDGWMDYYGSYEPNKLKFPDGMKYAADLIRKNGMIPGIWACPFVFDVNAPILHKYPDIIQKDCDGNPLIYDTSANDCYVLDPTVPGARDFVYELFTKFKKWGYEYYKLDWLRAIYEFEEVRFYNPKYNRTMAYQLALGWIREVLGPNSYILACGGLSEPAGIGLIDGQRTSKDVRGIWDGPEAVPKSGALVQIKQNLLRNYINRFYDTDPDATQIRLRSEPFNKNERKCVGVYQSEGHYTDEEAFTICAQQYLSGGLICISERFPELQESRLQLLRHISPACTPPAKILDFDHKDCPTLFLTEISPKCSELGDWWTLAVGNWEDEAAVRQIDLNALNIKCEVSFAIFEFHDQKFMGIYNQDDTIEVKIPAHGIRVLRLTPWNGKHPKILGTDLHISGGACEIKECVINDSSITGTIETKWQYPVKITAGFPENGDVTVIDIILKPGESNFCLSKKPLKQKPGN